MDRWLLKNAEKAVELYRRFDQSGEGMVTYDEFKAGKVLLLVSVLDITKICLGPPKLHVNILFL